MALTLNGTPVYRVNVNGNTIPNVNCDKLNVLTRPYEIWTYTDSGGSGMSSGYYTIGATDVGAGYYTNITFSGNRRVFDVRTEVPTDNNLKVIRLSIAGISGYWWGMSIVDPYTSLGGDYSSTETVQIGSITGANLASAGQKICVQVDTVNPNSSFWIRINMVYSRTSASALYDIYTPVYLLG